MKRYLLPLASVLWNLAVVLLLYTVCRLLFFLVNRPLFPEVDGALLFKFCKGGLRFDLSALLYTNLPYILLALLPLQARSKKGYRLATKCLYVIPNFFAYAIDLSDSVYFAYTSRRTTCAFFREFSGGGDNLLKIFLHEAAVHWYLVLAGAVLLFILIKAYREPSREEIPYSRKDYLLHTAVLLAILYPLVGGMRGGFGATVRPLSLNDVTVHIDKPTQAGIVLNTAFSLYRTIGSEDFTETPWYPDEAALEAAFSPIHPAFEGPMQKKNVVILILESFSAAYSGYLTALQGQERESYMPFLDSLMQESLVFRHSFAHGRLSIDALPAIMCGIPSLLESFTLTPYAQDQLDGIPRELGRKGYSSAFYHGAHRESMALAGSAHNTGFQKEYSRADYGNDADYDGTWAIWDEPFLQYFKRGIDQMPEPFVVSVFTASSHNPFKLPKEYEGVFPEGTQPIHKTIGYADYSLRRFFEEARKAPWYDNTLFVLTGDHTNQTDLPEYLSGCGIFSIPILFYAPDGSLKGVRDGVAQQLDIKPTLYHLLGYDEPYFSFGCDLLDTPDAETYAIQTLNGTYQFYQDGYMLLFDGQKSIGLYHFVEDRLMEKDLLTAEPERAAAMEGKLKAIIQQYMHRLTHNQLSLEP